MRGKRRVNGRRRKVVLQSASGTWKNIKRRFQVLESTSSKLSQSTRTSLFQETVQKHLWGPMQNDHISLSIETLISYNSVFISYCETWEQLKGLTMIFAGQEKSIYHLQKQGNINIFQNKYQNPHKFAEIMKKNRVLGKFLSWGHSNSVFNFLKF